MWFDGQRQPNTLYVASVSRGKDSTAMLRAIQLMGWPLDAICSVDIWFDDDTPAELPPMVAFKDEWDAKCLEWFGIPVTRLCATKREREREKQNQTENVTHENRSQAISTADERTDSSSEQMSDSQCSADRGAKSSNMSKLTYVDVFYRPMNWSSERERERETVRGWPLQRRSWCNDNLKTNAMDGVCDALESLLHGRTQTERSTDSRLSKEIGVHQCSNEAPRRAPGQGAENKYCPLHRHSS